MDLVDRVTKLEAEVAALQREIGEIKQTTNFKLDALGKRVGWLEVRLLGGGGAIYILVEALKFLGTK